MADSVEDEGEESHAFIVVITGAAKTECCAWLTGKYLRIALAIGNGATAIPLNSIHE